MIVGEPTADGLRAAGNWPSPEGLVDRLIAALELAADDESRPEEERTRLQKLVLGFKGVGYQVAIGAMGGAGGNLMTG
jgi:hypothetical protein